jgi:hypothetical protein
MNTGLKVAFASALCAIGLAAASAAPVLAQTTTYDFSGQLVDSDAYSSLYDTVLGTISGTFSVNTATGAATALSFTTVSESSQLPSDTYSEGLNTTAFSTNCCLSTASAGDDQLHEYGVTNPANHDSAELELIFPAGGGVLSTAGFAHSYYGPAFYDGDTNGTPYIVGAVTEVTSAAPEPAAWALMIVGIALVGGMRRYGSGLRRRPALAA